MVNLEVKEMGKEKTSSILIKKKKKVEKKEHLLTLIRFPPLPPACKYKQMGCLR